MADTQPQASEVVVKSPKSGSGKTNDELDRENRELRAHLLKLTNTHKHFYSSSDSLQPELDGASIPQYGNSATHCARMLKDHHSLDTNEVLNTSSYVNVYFEPEELEVANMGLQINLADQTVYPESFRVHNLTLNMVAKLWHCPKPADFNENGVYPGACTVGSTEACLLGGLALRFRWREWYAKRHNLSANEVKSVVPNLVISSCYQAAWEKFFRYFDVEANFVQPSKDTFTIDAESVKEKVNEKTLAVVCIMGNHYAGQYDPVWEVDAMLQKLNAENGWQVGIHVDGASGGFVAPFQDEVKPWDFRLPSVMSISSSGHKFGESCCGTGWIVWRQREELSEHVAISVSYLGGNADSYTLNFSRPATGVFVQYYKFHRLGRNGYRTICENRMKNAATLRHALKGMTYNDKPRFVMLDAGDKGCLPVVAACLNPELGLPYDDIDLQHQMQQYHWYVSGYKMSFHDPNDESTQPLFKDAPAEQTMFRVVVKANVTRTMIDHLIGTFKAALQAMDEMVARYQVAAPTTKRRQHFKGHAC